MAKAKKCVVLRGQRKAMQVLCPHCGHSKRIEYRKSGTDRRICGATELTKAPPLA